MPNRILDTQRANGNAIFATQVESALSLVSSDLAGDYAINAMVSLDLAGDYSILQFASADLLGDYAVESNTSVSADLAGDYAIESAVTLVSSDLAGDYAITATVSSDLAGSYPISVFVHADLAGSYRLGDSEVLLPNRARTIVLPAPNRFIKVSKDMIVKAASKRPAVAAIYSIDIRRELALVPGDAVVSVSASIGLLSGMADPNMGSMAVGAASFSGTVLSQKVAAGINGNRYYIKFVVATEQQNLEFIVEFLVTDEGAP